MRIRVCREKYETRKCEKMISDTANFLHKFASRAEYYYSDTTRNSNERKTHMENLKNYLKNYRKANGARLTNTAVSTRMTWARKAERHLEMPLDEAVRDEMSMFRALTALVANPDARIAKESNALRHAWKMTHGTAFPRLKSFRAA